MGEPRLRSYEILGLVASSDHSEVWRGRHLILGTEHALKRLRPGGDPALRMALLREGQHHALVRHPNVVRLTEAVRDTASDELVLVMDFVHGPSLADYLDRTNGPSRSQALKLTRALLRGLRAVHLQGLVHRDLKPENVMLSIGEGGRMATPKLMDFGLSKLLARDDAAPDGTVSGVFRLLGTPEYMAPEQGVAAADVDVRADLFSLGCILYELLTGHVCFDAEETREALDAVRGEDYWPPDQLVPDLPRYLTQLITRLLHADRSQRPSSCDEVLDALGTR